MVDQDSDLADTFGFIVLKFFQFENRGSMRSLALFAALIGSRYPGVGRDDFPPAIARTGTSTWKVFPPTESWRFLQRPNPPTGRLKDCKKQIAISLIDGVAASLKASSHRAVI